MIFSYLRMKLSLGIVITLIRKLIVDSASETG